MDKFARVFKRAQDSAGSSKRWGRHSEGFSIVLLRVIKIVRTNWMHTARIARSYLCYTADCTFISEALSWCRFCPVERSGGSNFEGDSGFLETHIPLPTIAMGSNKTFLSIASRFCSRLYCRICVVFLYFAKGLEAWSNLSERLLTLQSSMNKKTSFDSSRDLRHLYLPRERDTSA